MDSSAINLPSPGRRRGRYSDSFKADIVAACKAPGVSTAAVALANSLNANLVRRWVAESDPAHKAAVQLARVQSAATVSVSPTLASPSPAGPGPGDSDSDSDNVMAVLSIRDHHMNVGVTA